MSPKNGNVVQDAFIVAVSNSFFSFLAGFAVFSVAGYYQNETGLPWDEVRENLSGVSLAFVLYPAGLSLVGGAGGQALCVLFFVTLYMLGIDSAFSLTESVVLNLREIRPFHKINRTVLLIAVCIICGCTTLFYCTDIGFLLLDVVDAYINLALIIIGALEGVVAGWIYNKQATIKVVGRLSTIIFDLSYLTAFILFTSLSLGLASDENLSQGAVIGLSIGITLVVLLGGTFAALTTSQESDKRKSMYALFLKGPMSLAERLNETITSDGADKNWKFGLPWAICVKFIMSPLVSFLACQKMSVFVSKPYGDLHTSYQVLGAITCCIALLITFIGFLFPGLYSDPTKQE
jgi:SNF family Na+-dependent transporter